MIQIWERATPNLRIVGRSYESLVRPENSRNVREPSRRELPTGQLHFEPNVLSVAANCVRTPNLGCSTRSSKF